MPQLKSIAEMIDADLMNMERYWNDTDRGKLSTRAEACTNAASVRRLTSSHKARPLYKFPQLAHDCCMSYPTHDLFHYRNIY
jgi:hypothetical protein